MPTFFGAVNRLRLLLGHRQFVVFIGGIGDASPSPATAKAAGRELHARAVHTRRAEAGRRTHLPDL